MIVKDQHNKLDYSALPDVELIILCQEGNRNAFEVLVKKYHKIVYAMLYQLAPDWQDLNDLAQEVFIRIYRHIHKLRNPKTFKSWINQITVNLFYDELRKRPRRMNTVSLNQSVPGLYGEESETRDFPDARPCTDEIILNRELADHIKKAMLELPEQFRVVIVLREVQGLSYEEIAKTLDCELGTVKSRIARARARLQVSLKNYVNKLSK